MKAYRIALATVFCLCFALRSSDACLGTSMQLKAIGNMRYVRQAYVGEFVQSVNLGSFQAELAELIFHQHLTDTQKRRVVLIEWGYEGTSGTLIVTPNHYLMNEERKAQRADAFDVGDVLWVVPKHGFPVKASILSTSSNCGYVTNVFTTNKMILVNSVIASCFSQLRFLGVDILEVQSTITFPALFFYRIGLGVVNWKVDELMMKLGLSVCGEAC